MADKLLNLKPWKPGESPNPGGKPVGARNRITAHFLNDLCKHYETHGADAIDRLCQNDPGGYVKVVAALLPKEVEIKRPLEELDNEQLLTAIRGLESYLAARPTEAGSGETRQ